MATVCVCTLNTAVPTNQPNNLHFLLRGLGGGLEVLDAGRALLDPGVRGTRVSRELGNLVPGSGSRPGLGSKQ